MARSSKFGNLFNSWLRPLIVCVCLLSWLTWSSAEPPQLLPNPGSPSSPGNPSPPSPRKPTDAPPEVAQQLGIADQPAVDAAAPASYVPPVLTPPSTELTERRRETPTDQATTGSPWGEAQPHSVAGRSPAPQTRSTAAPPSLSESLVPPRTRSWQAAGATTYIPTTLVYEVSDLVEAMGAQYEVDVEDAKQLLRYEMCRTLRGNTGQFGWNNNNLVVRATERYHEIYQQRLAALRSTVFEQLEVAVCLASADSEAVQQLGLAWQVQAIEPLGNPESPAPLNTASATTARRQPLKWAIVAQQDSRSVEDRLQQSEGFQVLGRPQMRLFNGRRAVAEAAVQRRFVVGLRDQTPTIQTIPHGWKLDVLPETRGDQAIVRGHCIFTEIAGAETVESAGQRIQIPEVQQTQISWTTDVPLGDTLVVAGNRTPYTKDEQTGWKETVVLLRVTRVGESGEPADVAKRGSRWETRWYSIADLLPESESQSRRRIGEIAELLTASLRQKSGMGGEVAGDWKTRSLKIRQTAQGHRDAAALLKELSRLSRPSQLQLQVLSVSDEACGAAGLDEHAGFLVVNRSLVKELLEGDDTANATTLQPASDGTWRLEDGGTIRANMESRLGGRITRIEAVHQRGEVIASECRRELTANTALLLEVTPETPKLDSLPALGATIRRTLSLAPAPQRQFVVIRVGSGMAEGRGK